MRRHLVDEGRVSAGLQVRRCSNLTRLGNSVGKPSRMRARWTKELGLPVKDARSRAGRRAVVRRRLRLHDPRVQEVTRKVAGAATAAGVDSGILFDAEREQRQSTCAVPARKACSKRSPNPTSMRSRAAPSIGSSPPIRTA